MRITSKATYKIVRYLLEKKVFRQLEISEAVGVALSRVSNVVNWLVGLGYVAKGPEGYRLVSPAGILNIFPLYRRMGKLRVASFDVEVDMKQLHKVLREEKAALCLTSALQHYSSYFRDPGVFAYCESKALLDELSELRRGYVHVELYRDDLNEPEDFVEHKGVRITSALRTAIDLFCSNRAYAAERLVAKKW